MVTFQTVTPRLAATVLFNTPADPASSVFSASQVRPEGNQLLIQGFEKDIQRIQGFKTDLTAANASRLAEIRAELKNIKPATNPELKALYDARKLALNTEAFKILGKKYIDIDSDPALAQIKKEIDALLEPPLRGEQKTRLDRLRRLEKTAVADIVSRPGIVTLKALDKIVRQIAILAPPRLIGELTPAERRDYDRLAAKGNAHAGTEVFLPAEKHLKIEKIQDMIARLG